MIKANVPCSICDLGIPTDIEVRIEFVHQNLDFTPDGWVPKGIDPDAFVQPAAMRVCVNKIDAEPMKAHYAAKHILDSVTKQVVDLEGSLISSVLADRLAGGTEHPTTP